MARMTNSLLVFAFCISILPRPVEASGRELLTVTSEAGDLALGLQRGEGAISVTEIWVVLEGDSRPTRIKTYPGELGDLYFDPAGEGLIYLERSLRNQVWASSYYGGQSLPIIKNGIWKLSLDGAEEDLWPLPDDFQADEIAPSPDGRQLAIIGYRGNFFERINNGLWVSDETAGIKLLFAGKVRPLYCGQLMERLFRAIFRMNRKRSVFKSTLARLVRRKWKKPVLKTKTRIVSTNLGRFLLPFWNRRILRKLCWA